MDLEAKAMLRDLASTPARLRELSRRLDDAALAVRPSADEWSANEIIAHLRANADVWGSSIQRMIDEDHPTIRYFSPRGVMRKPEYTDRSFTEAFELFEAARRRGYSRPSMRCRQKVGRVARSSPEGREAASRPS